MTANSFMPSSILCRKAYSTLLKNICRLCELAGPILQELSQLRRRLELRNDPVQYLGIAGYAFVLPIVCALLAVFFRRASYSGRRRVHKETMPKIPRRQFRNEIFRHQFPFRPSTLAEALRADVLRRKVLANSNTVDLP